MSQSSGQGSETPDGSNEHHVHFEDEEQIKKDNRIIMEKNGANITVHIGFIQISHRYSIEINIPRKLVNYTNRDDFSIAEPLEPNLNFQVVYAEFNKRKDRIEFKVELFAHKENLLEEQFDFYVTEDGDPFVVTVVAKVLGKGKGTPMLKTGVHRIEYVIDDKGSESESSDWQALE